MKKHLLFKSVFISLILLSFTTLSAQVVADFEGVTKGSYASGTVIMNGYEWELNEALIGSLANDWKDGNKSGRLRGYNNSEIVLLTEKADGIGSISFHYRRFVTDLQVDWKVEYTLDDGLTWTQAGDAFTAPDTDVVQTFLADINLEGNVRIRILRASDDPNGNTNKRLNIDNITISNWPTSLSDLVLVNGAIFNPGDMVDFTWSAIGVSKIRFEVKMNDSYWEPIENFGVVDASLEAYQLPIPMNVGDETIKIRIADDFDSNTVSNEVEFSIVDNVFGGVHPEEGHYPEAGETNVAIDLYVFKRGLDRSGNPWAWSSRRDIVINFEEEEIVANTGNITISEQGQTEPVYTFNVATAENIEVDRREVRISLPGNLVSETTYEVFIPAGAFADGAATPNLSDEITWSFTTGVREGSDEFTGLNPQDSLFPEEDAVDVFTNLYFYRSGTHQNNEPWGWESMHTIMVDFVDEVVFNSGNISIFKDGDLIPVHSFDVTSAQEVWVSGSSLRITMPQDLLPNTTYKVEIPQGVIVDTTKPVANEWEGITWSFTTSEGKGGFNPDFVLYPPNDALDLPTDLFLYHEDWDDFFFNTIILTLDENIAKGTGNIVITNLTENVEVYSFDIVSENVRIYDNNSVIVSLPDELSANVLYSVEIESGAFTDTEVLKRPWQGITWVFTTGSRDSYKTIYEIRDQKQEPAFMGQYVLTSGVVTKKQPSGTLFLQDDDSQGWSGIFINDPVFGSTVAEGDEYTLVGKVGFGDEIAQLSDIRIPNKTKINQTFTPITIELPFSQEFLNMLVKIEGVIATDDTAPAQDFWVTDGVNKGYISKLWYAYPAEKDQGFSSITGVLYLSLGQNKLAPRNADDIEAIIVSTNRVKSNKVSVAPNPLVDLLNISAPSEIKTIEVISLVGESVLKVSANGKTSMSISAAGLSRGVYMVKIVLSNNQIIVRIVIKE